VPDDPEPPGDSSAILEALETWMASLSLLPHQLVLAALARELATQHTAAAAKELRATIAALTPTDAQRHRTRENAAKIKGTARRAPAKRAPKVRDAADAEPTNARRRAGSGGRDARVQAPSVAARIRGRGARGR
jgi:hypothetical protein